MSYISIKNNNNNNNTPSKKSNKQKKPNINRIWNLLFVVSTKTRTQIQGVVVWGDNNQFFLYYQKNK